MTNDELFVLAEVNIGSSTINAITSLVIGKELLMPVQYPKMSRQQAGAYQVQPVFRNFTGRYQVPTQHPKKPIFTGGSQMGTEPWY